MMKKTYITPLTIVEFAQAETMMAVSITNVGGDSGIQLGTGDTPDEADTKEHNVFGESIFD